LVALQELATKRGARIELDEEVVEIDRDNKRVKTENGKEYFYDKLIITSGAWTNRILTLANLSLLPIVVSMEQTVNVKPKPLFQEAYDWNNFPVGGYGENAYKAEDGGGVGRYFVK